MKDIADNWFMQAQSDLSSAKYNFKGKRLDVAAYLCHQSVEKGLKALCLKKGKGLLKIHDLVKLGTLTDAPKQIIEICNDLNPIYVEDRYPDFSDTIPAKRFLEVEIKEFFGKAKEAMKWIKAEMK